ncbi:MAG TPA: GNAT family N-acetyltransferase [Euzebyales bacterium]|nr:GNAT family N-acetyltransferase [Euzebyales bacterium]
MHEILLEDAAFDGAAAAALNAELQREYMARYGEPDATPVDSAEFAPPHGLFVVLVSGAEILGCAGLRRHDDGVVEIKRMFIRAAHRRRGHARRLLRALEDRARRLGYRRVVLETGTAQPEATALYASEGYVPIAGYGHYRDEPGNRCFAKDL